MARQFAVLLLFLVVSDQLQLEINNSPLLEMWNQKTDYCSLELEVRKKALLQKQTTTVKETGF